MFMVRPKVSRRSLTCCQIPGPSPWMSLMVYEWYHAHHDLASSLPSLDQVPPCQPENGLATQPHNLHLTYISVTLKSSRHWRHGPRLQAAMLLPFVKIVACVLAQMKFPKDRCPVGGHERSTMGKRPQVTCRYGRSSQALSPTFGPSSARDRSRWLEQT